MPRKRASAFKALGGEGEDAGDDGGEGLAAVGDEEGLGHGDVVGGGCLGTPGPATLATDGGDDGGSTSDAMPDPTPDAAP